MSYFRFEQVCSDCGEKWLAAPGIVGTTQIAAPPKSCPRCNSPNIKSKAGYEKVPAQIAVTIGQSKRRKINIYWTCGVSGCQHRTKFGAWVHGRWAQLRIWCRG